MAGGGGLLMAPHRSAHLLSIPPLLARQTLAQPSLLKRFSENKTCPPLWDFYFFIPALSDSYLFFRFNFETELDSPRRLLVRGVVNGSATSSHHLGPHLEGSSKKKKKNSGKKNKT